MLLKSLYDYLCNLSDAAMGSDRENIQQEIRDLLNKYQLAENDAAAIMDHQIHRFGFHSPMDLLPQKNGWDCFQLFLYNAVNGDGGPWIVKNPHERAKPHHVKGALSAFNIYADNNGAISVTDRRQLFLDSATGKVIGLPPEFSALLEIPDNYQNQCWKVHIEQAVRLFDQMDWWKPEKLEELVYKQGLSNAQNPNDEQLQTNSWNLISKFDSGNDWTPGQNNKVVGIAAEKGANFFADAGFLHFAKPDIHIRRVYSQLYNFDLKNTHQAHQAHYGMVSAILKNEEPYAQELFPDGFRARHLDRMIWLACSGRLFGNLRVIQGPGAKRAEDIAAMMRQFLDSIKSKKVRKPA